MSGVVVGVDGSPGSAHALDWAMKMAAVQQAPLTVLAVHQVAANQWTGNPVIYPADSDEVTEVRLAAEEMVQKASSRLTTRPATVTVRAISGLPAAELVRASADADMIVVGSRGAGGFAKLMTGSVGTQVVHHAVCPVVVVPFERDR